MEHEWIKNAEQVAKQTTGVIDEAEQLAFDREVVQNLRKYRGESLLKKAAMNVLVKHLGPS